MRYTKSLPSRRASLHIESLENRTAPAALVGVLGHEGSHRTLFRNRWLNELASDWLRSLRVLGRMEYAQILAGCSRYGSANNADPQIGTIMVRGDFIASSIADGVSSVNAYFGDSDDKKPSGSVKDESQIVSRINRLIIGGKVQDTALASDHYGIVAEHIGSVIIGGRRVPLQAGPGNDNVAIGDTGDLRVKEI